jgi:hypothetical protein
MRLFLLAVLLGLALGYLRGGRARSLASLPLPPGLALLVWGGAALQLAGLALPLETPGFDPGQVLVLISYALLAVFLLCWSIVLRRAGRRPRFLAWGLAVVAIGCALNVAVIAGNGGMPVSPEALEAVGRGEAQVSGRPLSKHVVVAEDTHLAYLGDVIPTFSGGPVISPGDIALALGLGTAVCAAMTRRSGKRGARESPFGGSLRPSGRG